MSGCGLDGFSSRRELLRGEWLMLPPSAARTAIYRVGEWLMLPLPVDVSVKLRPALREFPGCSSLPGSEAGRMAAATGSARAVVDGTVAVLERGSQRKSAGPRA